jgi:hypothetical protein
VAYRWRVNAAAALLATLLPASVLANDWMLVHESEQLRVERRPYQGSGLDELRGVLRLEASLNALMALLKDAPFNSHWVYRSGGARVLAEEGYARVTVYGIVDAPLPLRDRDTVVRFDYKQHPDTGEILISISNFPDYIPANDGYVRVPEFGGFWKLRPLPAGQVEVTYQVHGAPGGWVPMLLANYAAQLSVTRTLQNMGWAVKRYAGTISPHVRDYPGGSPPQSLH